MYTYSPLKTLQIKNFRNLGDVSIDFSESPIVSLIGENESGKTSIVKAFSVIALNANAMDQKYFIRDGAQAFGVKLTLADGTRIERIKDATYNRYSIYYTNGKVEDIKLDRASGLPPKIQELMGLITEPETKEFLHIRTYEDQLLFVVTTASTNYKMMHEALRIDQLVKASKIGTQEMNGLKNAVGENVVKISTLTERLKQVQVYDLSALEVVKEQITANMAVLGSLEKAISIIHRQREIQIELGQYDLIRRQGLQKIDESLAYLLSNIGRLVNSRKLLNNERKVIEKITSLGQIDTEIINQLNYGVELKNGIEKKRSLAGPMVDIRPEHFVDEGELIRLDAAISSKRRVEGLLRELERINQSGIGQMQEVNLESIQKLVTACQYKAAITQEKASLTPIITYIEQVKTYLASLATVDVECPNCKEKIALDISGILT